MNEITLSINESSFVILVLFSIFIFLLFFSSTIIIIYVKICERQEEILRLHSSNSEIRLIEIEGNINVKLQSIFQSLFSSNNSRNFNPKTLIDCVNSQFSGLNKNITEIFENLKSHINLNGQMCLDSLSKHLSQMSQSQVVQEDRFGKSETQKVIEKLGRLIMTSSQQEFKTIVDLIKMCECRELQTLEIVSSLNQSSQIANTNILNSLQRLETHSGLNSLSNFDIGGKLQSIEDAVKSPYVEDPKQREEVDRLVIETIRKLEERKQERESLASLF